MSYGATPAIWYSFLNAVFVVARLTAAQLKNGWMLPVSAWRSMPHRFGNDSPPVA